MRVSCFFYVGCMQHKTNKYKFIRIRRHLINVSRCCFLIVVQSRQLQGFYNSREHFPGHRTTVLDLYKTMQEISVTYAHVGLAEAYGLCNGSSDLYSHTGGVLVYTSDMAFRSERIVPTLDLYSAK